MGDKRKVKIDEVLRVFSLYRSLSCETAEFN